MKARPCLPIACPRYISQNREEHWLERNAPSKFSKHTDLQVFHHYDTFWSTRPSCLSCVFHSKLYLALPQIARSHTICNGLPSSSHRSNGSWNSCDYDHRIWKSASQHHKHFETHQALNWVNGSHCLNLGIPSIESGIYLTLQTSRDCHFNSFSDFSDSIVLITAVTSVFMQLNCSN